jgi:hypothetical protein
MERSIKERVADWVVGNKAGLVLLIVTAAAFVGMVTAGGCSVEDMIQVQVPKGVQQDMTVPGTLTLREAEPLMKDWVAKVERMASEQQNELIDWAASKERDSQQFAENIGRGWAIHDVLASTMQLGLTTAEVSAGTIPGGAIGLSALAGLAGLMFRRPGDEARISREKEDSFNAGRETAISEVRKLNGDGMLTDILDRIHAAAKPPPAPEPTPEPEATS